MGKSFRKKLENDIILLDGGVGTYAQKLGLTDEYFADRPGCMEYLSMVKPEFIEQIHMDYLDAGADAIETNTFGGNSIKLSEYGLAEKAYEVNLASAKLARDAADAYSTDEFPRYVIGSMGPTGKLPSSTDPVLGDVSYKELRKVFYEQALALVDGGVDAILVETAQDLLEMKAALSGAKEALLERDKDLVLISQCTLANNGRMLLGTDISAVMTTLGYMGADVIGINCSTGPVEMEGAVSALSEKCPAYVSCVPNAGLPVERDGETVYPMKPEELASVMRGFLEKYRIDIIGGCCGTEPDHIRALRGIIPSGEKQLPPENTSCASSYAAMDIKYSERPLKVGERINTQGSRKMKNLLLEEDFDGILELGKSQQKAGAHILDVCSVLTERSTEDRDAVILTKRLAESVTVPLMIDSTDADVIEEALRNYPGTAFINSANMEDGGEKARRIFSIAKEYAGFVVCLAIDEDGMAKTLDRKLEVASRLYRIATEECGLDAGRVIFDMLTFSLGTGEEEYASSAIATFDAIKGIKKKFPKVLTASGVSNVSFGLSKEARKVLNMVYLHHAVEYGLDLGIVNPSEYLAYEDIPADEAKLAEDLIFNRHDNALQDIVDHFEKKEPKAEEQVYGTEEMTAREKLKRCILERDRANILEVVKEAMSEYKAEEIINTILMPAMKDVGDKLDSGEMVLPYVLQAAEAMRKAIDYLEGFLPKDAEVTKGKVLLATVEGDVHDIGKNLVKMILKNNGFDVIDLGKQVKIKTIIEKAKEYNVDAVGLSALLVSTARHMKVCVQSMHDAGLYYPILVGGAPINEGFAREISILNDKSIYRGGVFYGRDAFTALKIMQTLSDPAHKRQAREEYIKEEEKGVSREQGAGSDVASSFAASPETRQFAPVIEPPFFGVHPLVNVSVDEVFDHLNEEALFRLAWGAKLKDPQELKRIIKEEYRPHLKAMKDEVIRKGWLDLKAVYGYFKCRMQGEYMFVLDEEGKAICRIHFGLTPEAKSIALYFKEKDITAFQTVTVGSKIGEAIRSIDESGEHTKAYFLHGLSVHLAEALASFVHSKILDEVGLSKPQGKRYSPGYPLWPDLADQKKIFEILEVERRIGLSLTDDYQIIPEQSTTAMIVFDPEAEY